METPAQEPEVPSRRAGGRPRNPVRSTTVNAWVPLETFDRLASEAHRRGWTLSKYVAKVLMLSHKPDSCSKK